MYPVPTTEKNRQIITSIHHTNNTLMDGHNDKCNYSSGVISNTALFCQWQNKNIPIAFVASKCKIINQKNLMLPFAPTSCASFLSQETPSFVTNNNSASFLCQTHSAQLSQNHLVPTLNQSAKIAASVLTMDQIVFHLCLPRQQHPSGLYLLPWYHLKRKTSKKCWEVPAHPVRMCITSYTCCSYGSKW